MSPNPYLEAGLKAGLSEQEVISEISDMLDEGTIRRLGVVVRHRSLGYKSNAMVVWDIPDDRVGETGRRFSEFDFVTLCYRRPRRLPDWPYNLFCMIHGRERGEVLAQIDQLVKACGLSGTPRDVLFSRRCFKQRGAVYARPLDDPSENMDERDSP